MDIFWKILASCLAFISSSSASIMVLGLGWMTVGASESRKQAVNSLSAWSILICVLGFSGLAIWLIWKQNILIGLVSTLGAWLFSLLVFFNANSIVDLIEK